MKASATNYKMLLKYSPLLMLLLAAAVWQLALKKSWESYQEYRLLSSSSAQNGNWSISPGYTRSRMESISLQYKHFEVDTLRWKNQLWNHVALLAGKNQLLVKSFPAWSHAEFDQQAVLRQEVELVGSYPGLIRMQAELESIPGLGRISSLSYRKSRREENVTMSLILTGIPTLKVRHKDE